MKHFLQNYLEYFKWIFLGVFVIGYLLTFHLFRDDALEYLLYTMLVFFSCGILLARARLFDQKLVAFWVAFILFIVLYFVRFYWIALDPVTVRDMLPWNPYKAMLESRVSLLKAFGLAVLAFVVFNLSATACMFSSKNTTTAVNPTRVSGKAGPGALGKGMLLSITLLASLLAYLTYKFNIGEMGVSSGNPLPLRLKGVIFYARMVFVPLVIVLAIYLAERNGKFLASRIGVCILILNGVVDMMLRSSRSGLLLALVLLVFLVLANGIRLRRNEKIIFLVLLPLGFVLVPLMTEYRYIRVNSGASHFDAFLGAFAKNTGPSQILKGFQFVMFRMPGIESLWCMLASRGEPLGMSSIAILNSQNGIAGHLTTTIYPMKTTDNTLLAPGFVGWFYLVAGWPAIVLGAICAGVLSIKAWAFLGRETIVTAPVAKVFFLWMMFLSLTEGTLDGMRYMFVVGVATLITIETGMRSYEKKRPIRAG